ncbi:MAG: GTP cyclohydrolase I FolE [Bacteroidales bacterium]|nr:GTP cyclohydrolase I FolE [Bacteroidales bacterium]MBD5177666.1 GTP cyclohydrolase I FolE [Bacteroidales bacterium]
MTEEERIDSIAAHIKAVMELLGEDVSREGLVKTPVRAAKALSFLTSGYSQTGEEIVGDALFEHEGSNMIVVKDIEFYSMCEHHILPFFGKVSIGYIPNGKIVGISKLARLVNVYARRLQVQERFTAQICRKVMEILGAKGAIVVCSGEHLCMKMRGVEKQHSATTTLHYEGDFNDPVLRAEFLNSI